MLFLCCSQAQLVVSTQASKQKPFSLLIPGIAVPSVSTSSSLCRSPASISSPSLPPQPQSSLKPHSKDCQTSPLPQAPPAPWTSLSPTLAAIIHLPTCHPHWLWAPGDQGASRVLNKYLLDWWVSEHRKPEERSWWVERGQAGREEKWKGILCIIYSLSVHHGFI